MTLSLHSPSAPPPEPRPATTAVTTTIRLDVPEQPERNRQLDIVLPPRSSLAEVLDEVLELLDAPSISVPWQGRTAAGVPIDATRPLHTVPFLHGGVLVLGPYEQHAAPVVKDTAHALADAASTPCRRGLDTLPLLVAGLVLCLGAVAAPLSATAVAWWGASLTLAASAVALRARRRLSPEATACYMGIAQLSAAISGASAAQQRGVEALALSSSAAGWTLVAAAGGLAAATALGAKALHIRHCAAAITTVALLTVCGGLLAASGEWVAASAGTIAVAMVAMSAAPSVALKTAGLRVSLIPSAGQDLEVADHTIAEPEKKARRTAQILGGFYLGLTVVLSPLLLVLAQRADVFALALVACTVGSVVVHAARHHDVWSMWALWVSSCAGVVALALCALRIATAELAGQGSWIIWPMVIAGAVLALAGAAPLLTGPLSTMEPTWQRRLERVEHIALAAIIPLSAHLMGIFTAIRTWEW
ncbi:MULTISPECIES: type VII secretion integral membrane protein EccD [Corynebacterium]|uniref:type VII secretion integral membrane protein EccD n=1 Tax=Corynebacterium TaxID=1716 RepID=UPI00178C5129|nr:MULTISPECIES: type VII secretion integral membrane protein EccD [Corynebacterium]